MVSKKEYVLSYKIANSSFHFPCESTTLIFLFRIWFLLCTVGCYQETNDEISHASLGPPMSEESDISNATQLTSEEEKENDRKIMEQWTRMFFSMGRTPLQGEQILIFPGLCSK